MNGDITYETARLNVETVLVKGRFSKADVFVARPDGARILVKDFAQKGFWERNLIGRVVIGREVRAYRALAGVDGLPRRFKRLSSFALAVEFLEGTDFGAAGQERIGSELIAQFERIIREIHARGWVHLDLHRRNNILLVQGKVYIVDLASALHPGMIPFIGPLLTRLIGIADRLSLIKMKTIFAPLTLTSRERTWLAIRNRIMFSKWKTP